MNTKDTDYLQYTVEHSESIAGLCTMISKRMKSSCWIPHGNMVTVVDRNGVITFYQPMLFDHVLHFNTTGSTQVFCIKENK